MTSLDTKRIDDIERGYIEAMLWSSTDDNEEPLDRNYGPEDIAPETRKHIREVCERFYAMVKDIDYLSVHPGKTGEYTEEEMLGHDLWLTSRGHGTGFWDSDRWAIDGEDIEGEDNPLCQACYKAHNQDRIRQGLGSPPYIGDDGLIYL